ncbi:MAG: hypothetical protein BalsKO_10710 [Balneolaceae bacterium]
MEENENKFLRFEGIRGKHLNYPLVKKEDLNIYETPFLNGNGEFMTSQMGRMRMVKSRMMWRQVFTLYLI